MIPACPIEDGGTRVSLGGDKINGKLESTPEAQAPRPTAIDQATLVPIVQSALNSGTVEVINWECKQLHASAGTGSAVYRFSGEGRDQGQMMPWSLILKVLQSAGDGINVSDWNYYRREADAHRSGWLDDLPGGLAAPRNFGITEHPDGTCWIWLEDVTDDIGSHWPLEHYGIVARHLGQFNGAYLAGQPLPSWPWLSSGWLRQNTENCAPAMTPLHHSLEYPLVRRWWPVDASDRLFRLWAEREIYLDALDRLPQTFCHLDAFRRNLFARKTADGDYQTVAIDWAFSGRGAIGQELGPLIQASVLFFEVDLTQAQRLEDIVFEGYLQGLRDAGRQGDLREVGLGYTAASSLNNRFNETGRWLAVALDENLHAGVQHIWGRPIGEVVDHVAQARRFFGGRIDEARDLMDILG